MENKQRLAKRIAESGIASRRDAEKMIADGRVYVDGICITSPVCFVDDQNVITVDGHELQRKSDEIIVWKLYKPAGTITTRRDPYGRKTVFDLDSMKEIKHHRLLYVGRLDYNSEGLLLFTNNGDIARKMELPKFALKRTYRARIFGKFSKNNVEALKNGVTIDGIRYSAVNVEIETSEKANNWLKITLSEGKNREIRRIMEHFGCTVNRLIRISYGPFTLGKLQPGIVSRAPDNEIKRLIDMLNC